MKWFGRKASETRAAPGDPERVAEVEAVLDDVRPMLRVDGGDIRLAAVVDDEVRLELEGACSGCGMSFWTMRQGVEPELRRRLAWVRRISVE